MVLRLRGLRRGRDADHDSARAQHPRGLRQCRAACRVRDGIDVARQPAVRELGVVNDLAGAQPGDEVGVARRSRWIAARRTGQPGS